MHVKANILSQHMQAEESFLLNLLSLLVSLVVHAYCTDESEINSLHWWASSISALV